VYKRPLFWSYTQSWRNRNKTLALKTDTYKHEGFKHSRKRVKSSTTVHKPNGKSLFSLQKQIQKNYIFMDVYLCTCTYEHSLIGRYIWCLHLKKCTISNTEVRFMFKSTKWWNNYWEHLLYKQLYVIFKGGTKWGEYISHPTIFGRINQIIKANLFICTFYFQFWC